MVGMYCIQYIQFTCIGFRTANYAYEAMGPSIGEVNMFKVLMVYSNTCVFSSFVKFEVGGFIG